MSNKLPRLIKQHVAPRGIMNNKRLLVIYLILDSILPFLPCLYLNLWDNMSKNLGQYYKIRAYTRKTWLIQDWSTLFA